MEPNSREFYKQCAFQKFCNTVLHNEACDTHRELRRHKAKVKTPEATKAAKDISLRRKPVYQSDLDDIEMYFMAAVKEIKKGIGSHYAEQEALSKKVAEKMFNELTKGQDVQRPNITAEQVVDVVLDSVSDMEGATPETLEQLRSGLLGVMQSQGNAHEADE